MTSEEKRTLIKQFIEAYNTFNVQELSELMHPEVTFSNISGGEEQSTAQGVDEFLALAEASQAQFESRHHDITGYLFNGNHAVVNVDRKGVLAQDLPSGLKAGEFLHLSGKTEFNFEGNKFKRIVDYS